MKPSRLLIVCLSLFIAMMQLGCQLRPTDTTSPDGAALSVTATPQANGLARVRMQMRLSEFEPNAAVAPSRLSVRAAVAGAVASSPSVTYSLTFINLGVATQPLTTISQTVPIIDGAAEASFPDLPLKTAIGAALIEGADLAGYTRFRGALDLVAGDNLMVLAPASSTFVPDVLAATLLTLASAPADFATLPQKAAQEVGTVVGCANLNSPTVYADVLDGWRHRDQLPSVVLVTPTDRSLFTDGADIVLTALATPTQAPIDRVEFFADFIRLGAVATPPYMFRMPTTPAAEYILTARVVDTNGKARSSPWISITGVATIPTVVPAVEVATLTNQREFSVVLNGTDTAFYRFSVDGGEFSADFPINVPLRLQNLTNGQHVVEVLAGNAQGVWVPLENALVFRFDVDAEVPVARVNGAPASMTAETACQLDIHADDAVGYRWQLDNGTWSATLPMNTPIQLTGLAAGAHQVAVISVDAAGNWQPATMPTVIGWTIDNTARPAVITAGRPAMNASEASITIGGTGITAYKYAHYLDSASAQTPVFGVEQPVSQPIVLTGIREGWNYLLVIGKTAAGVWQSENTPTRLSWFSDQHAAPAWLENLPPSMTNQNSINVRVSWVVVPFAGDSIEEYRYSLDGAAFGPTTPVNVPIQAQNIAPGTHTLRVIGHDSSDNWQSESNTSSYTWVIDNTPPTAALLNTPNSVTRLTSAVLNVGGEGVVKYSYRLADLNDPYTEPLPIDTPIRLRNLAPGAHTLHVIGCDAAGNWQSASNPTVLNWTVSTAAVTSQLTNCPPVVTNLNFAEFIVRGPDVVGYVYRLDSGAWSTRRSVAQPLALSGLAPSPYPHTVQVLGVTNEGVWQATGTPTVFNWTIRPVGDRLTLQVLSAAETPTQCRYRFKFRFDAEGVYVLSPQVYLANVTGSFTATITAIHPTGQIPVFVTNPRTGNRSQQGWRTGPMEDVVEVVVSNVRGPGTAKIVIPAGAARLTTYTNNRHGGTSTVVQSGDFLLANISR